jgi:hypothetical protein
MSVARQTVRRGNHFRIDSSRVQGQQRAVPERFAGYPDEDFPMPTTIGAESAICGVF